MSSESAPIPEVPDHAMDTSSLKDIVSETNKMLESILELSNSAFLPSDAVLSDTWRELKHRCELIQPLVSDCEVGPPQLLVVGQSNSGKSSLINEMLGQTVVSQSQGPNRVAHQISKICYSPTSYTNGSNGQDETEQSPSSIEEAPITFVERGLPNEFLKQSRFEIVDCTGSSELPPITEWDKDKSGAPTAIVYVIDAIEGISVEVEEDLMQLRMGCSSSQLFFVLNKMDALTGIQDTDEASSVGVRDNVLTRLRQWGLCSPGDSTLTPVNLFCLSCRTLKSRRRKNGENNTANDFNKNCIMEMDRLRQTLSRCISLRLQRQLQDLLPRLEETSAALTALAIKTDDFRASRKQAWKTILDLNSRIARSRDQADSATVLLDRLRDKLKSKKPEIQEAAKDFELREPMQYKQQQNWAEAEIERLVRELQQRCCQEFAEAELTDRLRTTDDVITKLISFQDEYFDSNRPLAPRIEKKFFIKLDSDRHAGASDKTSSLTRRFSANKVDFMFRSKTAKHFDPKWKLETAKKFTSFADLKPLLKQSLEQLTTLIHVAQTDTMTAVDRAVKPVESFLKKLKNRKNMLREISSTCLKLWLRLRSVLSETECSKLLKQSLSCIAIGSQGSPVYAEKRLKAETSRKTLVLKKIYLDDRQLTAMAAALHYSCTSTRDSLVRIEHLQLKRLNDRPTLWKLLVWTERLPFNMEQQLSELCQTLSLSDRLKIGLNIAESLAQMHLDGQPHLNLHMGNIFVSPENRSVRLSDVGQGRYTPLLLLRREATLPSSGCPPELLPQPAVAAAVGQIRSVNFASADTFSLGAVLKALIFGSKSPPKFEEINDEISTLIEDCIQSNPAQRPTPADVAERLRQLLKEPTKAKVTLKVETGKDSQSAFYA
ncbi:hypothetical protein BOX15_Mlig032330g2 [Macrostomum lignano]|uniref:Protein kinase domain-containing protein n=1 Tax=Macrostomum lignano TaxID=282301 RepID=A0A267GJ75_9PLAT|nr:hypothetical protein BOX15_Mlig032330g2 [Macrostomum lignano]